MHLGYSEAAAKHQGENGLVSRRGDDGKEPVKGVIGNGAGQATTLLEAVSPGDDGVGRWVIGVGVQELVQGAEGSQSSVDGGGGVALRFAMGDVGIHIADGDAVGRCVGPGEEVLQVAGVMLRGAAVGVLAAQPAGEQGDFLIHCCLLAVELGVFYHRGGVLVVIYSSFIWNPKFLYRVSHLHKLAQLDCS